MTFDEVKLNAFVEEIYKINHDDELSPQDQRELTGKMLIKFVKEATL
jgi:hypothetical protein